MYIMCATGILLGGKEWGFRTATGKELQKNKNKKIRDLADAIYLPQKVAIIKCKVQSNLAILEAKGKEAADQATKLATVPRCV